MQQNMQHFTGRTRLVSQDTALFSQNKIKYALFSFLLVTFETVKVPEILFNMISKHETTEWNQKSAAPDQMNITNELDVHSEK